MDLADDGGGDGEREDGPGRAYGSEMRTAGEELGGFSCHPYVHRPTISETFWYCASVPILEENYAFCRRSPL